MESGVSMASLLAKWGQVEQSLPAKDPFGLRIRRATSWLERAGKEGNDADAAFIFCWIAFNAAYGDERVEQEWVLREDYFRRILPLEGGGAINRALWQRFRDPIKGFVGNKFVHWRFWDSQRGVEGADDWKAKFERDRGRVNAALSSQVSRETPIILRILFDRLYVLRNQLLHGGATWNSSVNREQVQDGARIMYFLVPIFIDVMLANPGEDWGVPRFPVVYGDKA